jgi:N-acetylglutamate synthase-like GNAT family acetyltransferase
VEIELREPKTAEDLEKYYDLRWRILRQPWNGERQRRDDALELTAIHLAAWEGNRIVGAGRLQFLSIAEGQVRGMAVERGCEKCGIGSLILQGLEQRAALSGVRRIVLHARESALEFYRKNGYHLVDRSYTLFDTIVHWRMEKDL